MTLPPPPGTQPRRRWHPRVQWELLVCSWSGHGLVGTDAAELRPQDSIFARAADGVRWYRCLRCDAWVALDPPAQPARRHPPDRDEILLPIRGKALRDKIVLRLIAIDRAFHVLILGLLALAVFLVAGNQGQLRHTFYRVLADLQGPSAASVNHAHGTLGKINDLLTLKPGTLQAVGIVLLVLAFVEGAEAVGLWYQKRWAEYLTFVVTAALLPLEVYELTQRVSVFKLLAFVVNVAIVIYLLLAKRLFGLRGGAAADEAERARDSGWGWIEQATPPAGPRPAGSPGVPAQPAPAPAATLASPPPRSSG
ncbi:MAG TPA: DUF2127 domain-containing protein [Solirubrobacteraceae bacterium]|nr:DUF2127 domain-containing protein [Solirubrobacteraceae bacterium]